MAVRAVRVGAQVEWVIVSGSTAGQGGQGGGRGGDTFVCLIATHAAAGLAWASTLMLQSNITVRLFSRSSDQVTLKEIRIMLF